MRELIASETPRSFYDLRSLAEEVRREYFPAAPLLPIHWGKRVSRRKRRSIRLGSYHRPSTKITIHPSLDAPTIPLFFIQSIIHHEYLHHVVGPNHDRKFHVREREFRYYKESKEWLRKNLPTLLGRKARPQRPVTPLPPVAIPVQRPLQLSLF